MFAPICTHFVLWMPTLMINCSFRVHSDDFYVEIKCKNVLRRRLWSTLKWNTTDESKHQGATVVKCSFQGTVCERAQRVKGWSLSERRNYFHNGVVTIALWFVLVPQVRALLVELPCTAHSSVHILLGACRASVRPSKLRTTPVYLCARTSDDAASVWNA